MTADGTVYVVDDDPSVRRAMRRLLRSVGYDVVVLESADALLALSGLRRPLCLVADVRMPGATGFDLLSALRARGLDVPVIFISGHADAEMASRAMADGALAFLTKPMDDAVLLAAIEEGLRRDRESLGKGRGP